MPRAFIVIDIQQDYFTGGLVPLDGAEAVEAALVAAIARAQAAGDRVLLVQHLGAAGGAFDPDGAGVAIRPAIRAAAPEAPVVQKRVADAFQDTGLAAYLEGIDAVVIAGMMTQNCVVFTALEAKARGFAVTVGADLCAAPSALVHQVALRALGSKVALADQATLWP